MPIPLKILVIDDDREDYLLTRELLTELPWKAQIEWAASYEALLELLDQQTFDVHLIDYRLGTYSALDVLKVLAERRSGAPAIIFTGTNEPALAEEAMRAGAVDYLVKGQVNADSLERSLRYSLARKEFENKLRLSEAWLRIALDAARMAVWDYDPASGRINGSPRLYELFGIAPPVQPSQLKDLLEMVAPEDRDRVARQLEAALESSDVYEEEFAIATPAAERKWLSIKGKIERDQSGRAVRIVGGTIDITAPKRTEQEARNAARQKDNFLAMLAHELRNPLAAISNAIELAARSPVSRLPIEIIRRQVHHLVRLIDDLLDVSRITRGKFELRCDAILLAECIERACTAVQPMVENRKHTLQINLPSSPITVHADTTRVEQALVNLLVNAIKYSEERGTITVSLREENGYAVITVSDTGVGIAPEMLPHIFELFTQADGSLARSQGGLGIGLTLVRQIAELHGGNVSAHSPGKGSGSTFTLRLPLVEQARRREGASTAASAGRTSTPQRVLVVDDNADNAESLALLLLSRGHEVSVAHDGPQALDVAATFQPGVIVLDIGLPEMSGYDVASALRSRSASKDCLIVAVTGYGQEDDVQEALSSGFDYHLTKPVNVEVLTSIIERRKDAPSAGSGTGSIAQQSAR